MSGKIVKTISVRRKLIALQTISTILLLLVSAGTLITNDIIQIRKSLVQNLLSITGTLSRNLSGPLSYQEEKQVERILNTLQYEKGVIFGVVLDDRSAIISKYGDVSKMSQRLPVFEGESHHVFFSDHIDFFKKIYDEEYIAGYLYLRFDLYMLRKLYQNYAYIAVAVLIISLIVASFMARLTQRIISVPLNKILEVIEKITNERDYNLRVLNKGTYLTNIKELLSLSESFDHMLEVIDSAQRKLKDANDRLEDQVRDRTKQLAEELKKISNLLNNMRQAVFTVDSKGEILAPISKYSESLFGEGFLNQKVFKSVYKDLSPTSPEYSLLMSAYETVFGEGDLQWSFSEDNLPKKLKYIKDNNVSFLRVSYSPLWSDTGTLDKIMYVVEDVTVLEKLEQEVALERALKNKNSQVLQQFSVLDMNELKNYLSSVGQMLTECLHIFDHQNLELEKISLAFRHLHTIKGNSRLLGISTMADPTHEVESRVVLLRTGIENKEVYNEVLRLEIYQGILTLIQELGAYTKIAEEVFRIEDGVKMDNYRNLYQQLIKTELTADFDKIKKMCLLLGYSDAVLAAEDKNFKQLVQVLLPRLVNSTIFVPVKQDQYFWKMFLSEVTKLKLAYENGSESNEFSNWSLVGDYAKKCGVFFIAKITNENLSKDRLNLVFNYVSIALKLNLSQNISIGDQADLIYLMPKFQLAELSLKFGEEIKSIYPFAKQSLNLDNIYSKLLSYSIEGDDLQDDVILKEMIDLITSKVISSKTEGIFEILRMIDFYRGNVDSIKRKQKNSFQEVHIEKLYELERLTQSKNATIDVIKDSLRTLSYIPLTNSFYRYFMMVDELSIRLGKNVKLKIIGEEVFVSREMAIELNDALMHMVRNGLDHGIETTEVRLQLNKPLVSSLELEVVKKASGFKLFIRDDGKGMDPDYIFDKACEKGVAKVSERSKMTDEDKWMLIMQPNFSTAEAITDLSGRGVGMDVVKTNVERLGGRIGIKSKLGKGTEFIIEF